MKKEIMEYVDKCLIFQMVITEHQRPIGELRPLKIPTWKWDYISMDVVIRLPFLLQKRMLSG